MSPRCDRPPSRLILLAPIQPARTGNGLAMRAELFRRAAARDFHVRTVVVPVAGWTRRGSEASDGDVVLAPDAVRARKGVRALLADPRWRRRLADAGTLPPLACAASPGMVDAVTDALDEHDPVAVHVMRSYLGPLGAAVAERLEAAWATLDLDEDDAAFSAATGDVQRARAYERLLDAFGGCFDRLSAASAAEAQAIADRHGLTVRRIPNAVELLPGPVRRSRDPRSGLSLLFVGNLTYAPNVGAGYALVQEIAPMVRRRLGRRVAVRLVGSHHPDLQRLSAADVEVAGFVSDLAPVYAAADMVVVPLKLGAGTRIKLLEAFAHRVPVVASPIAVAGLEVSDGQHLPVAEGAEHTAAAVAAVATDHALATRLVNEAAELVRERYSIEAVIPAIRDFVAPAARVDSRPRQPSGAL